jgi:hypothetical protein
MTEMKRRKIQREDPYGDINVHHMIEALYYHSYHGEAVDFVELTEARNNYLANQGQTIPYDDEPDVWDGPKELLHTVEISHATGNVPAYRQVVHEHPTILGAVVLSMDYMDLIDQEQLARIANSILWLG